MASLLSRKVADVMLFPRFSYLRTVCSRISSMSRRGANQIIKSVSAPKIGNAGLLHTMPKPIFSSRIGIWDQRTSILFPCAGFQRLDKVSKLPWFLPVPPEYFSTSSAHHVVRKMRTRKELDQLPFEIDTNLTHDVLIYSNASQNRYFFLLSLFGVIQFGFWAYLAAFTYNTLRDTPVKKDEDQNLDVNSLPFWRRINLGDNKFRFGTSFLCATIGYILLFIALIYPLRAVRYIHLLKGGQTAKITTYGPFGYKKVFTAPVRHITSLQSRAEMKAQISLKVKNRYLFYLLDSNGQFHNTSLFDYVVGLKRKL